MGRKKKVLDLYAMGCIRDDDQLDVYPNKYNELAIRTLNERQLKIILNWLKPLKLISINEYNFIPKSFVDHYFISKTYAYDAEKTYNAIEKIIKVLKSRKKLFSWDIIKFVDEELDCEDIIKAKILSLIFPYKDDFLYIYRDKPELVEILKKYFNMLK